MDRSADLFARACQVIPAGVNSPVRAFGSVGGSPVYVRRGAGCRIETADDRELVDFCCSWGPLILGHSHPRVVAALTTAAAEGTSFGINHEREVEFAETLCRLVPALEQVRCVSSGTEATMTALRLARGATGRARIVKFAGCYHGHSDALLVAAGSGLLTGGTSSSAGVSEEVAAQTHVLPYNDLPAVEALLAERGREVAAIIVEPVAGNMGLVAPQDEFLAGLRAACDRCGALLIFDEVITGFRFGPTTWSELCGVQPDLLCLGKIVGGGLPLGAVGGRREIMDFLAPTGPVYQAGTLSGNPLALAAGLATLTELTENPPYEALAQRGRRLATALNALPGAHQAFHCAHLGGAFTVFFTGGPCHHLAHVQRCDTARFAAFFRELLAAGFYLSPSQFELDFLSTAHSDADVDAFLAAAEPALKKAFAAG